MGQVRIEKAKWDKLDDKVKKTRTERINNTFLNTPAFLEIEGAEYAVFDDVNINEEYDLFADALTEHSSLTILVDSQEKVRDDILAAFNAKKKLT